MLLKIKPTLFGVMSSIHSALCCGSLAAKFNVQLTLADSAYRLYMTLLTWPTRD